MIKKIFALLIALIIIFVSYLGLRFVKNPPQTAPYPYVFTINYEREADKAKNADIILMGDHLTTGLEGVLQVTLKELSKDLKSPLTVYNWGRSGEIFSRTLQKLKTLSNYNGLIIYLGAGEEHKEDRVLYKNIKKLRLNFKLFKSNFLGSVIFTLPSIARLLYFPYKHITLGPTKNLAVEILSSKHMLKKMEWRNIIFKEEFKEFLFTLKENETSAIFIAPPINLDTLPQKICIDGEVPSVDQLISSVQKDLMAGKHKQARSRMEKKIPLLQGHAMAHYVYGQTLKETGDYLKARQQLYQADLFDCLPKGPNIAYNKIIITEAEGQNFSVIDFNRIVNSHYGRNELFLHPLIPQSVYFDDLTKEITPLIKESFDL
jgi:hypothetical protein